MKKLIVCTVCFGLFAFAAAAGSGTPSIEGSWTLTAATFKGKKLTDDAITKVNFVLTFKDGKYTVSSMGKQVKAGTYKLDPKAKPATIDLMVTEGKDKDKTQVGIYTLERDQLTVAISSVDIKTRPANFESSKDGDVTVLKRNK